MSQQTPENAAAPAVSIVLPTHNGQRYLRRSVESCLAQTYPHWELILVDDASTDRTPELIEEFVRRDGRIRAVRNAAKGKLPGALNVGFSTARGRYFTWTSDDNAYRPAALETMVAALESNPDVDMVYADYTVIDAEGRPVGSKRVASPRRLLLKNIIGGCFLYRAAVARKLGPYAEDLFLAEDYDYWVRASIYFRLAPLHTDLYLYRMHPQSLTQKHVEQIERAAEQCLDRHFPRLHWATDRERVRCCLKTACKAKRRGDAAVAEKWLARALRISPLALWTSPARAVYLLTGIAPGWELKALWARMRGRRKAA